MARTRTKKAAPPGGGRVQFIECEQSGMCVITSLDSLPTLPKARALALNGAYVKFAPTIRASERTGVDSRAIREQFLAEGAVAVVIAPVVVPDVPTKAPDATQWQARNAEDHLRQWFADVKAPKKVVADAVEQALATAAEAGL